MVIIIGGRQSILSQIPEDIRKAHPRLTEPLTSELCAEMVTKSLDILQDEQMAQSHMLFCDVIRLVLALQLSEANNNFGKDLPILKGGGTQL